MSSLLSVRRWNYCAANWGPVKMLRANVAAIEAGRIRAGMLPYTEHGSGKTTLVLMPFLGGSQLEWTETVRILEKKHRCLTVDLPGFGDARKIPGYTVSEMADAVIELLESLGLERYLLVGHSMAGKVSAVVARKLVDDAAKPTAPIGLVLVAPSPPGPEPMPDGKREEMIESLGTVTPDDHERAQQFIRDNIALKVPEAIFDRTVGDVELMNRDAWLAWLNSGSKEDWADRVGILGVPTLIVAGEKDGALGPEAQEKLTLPHFSAGHLVELPCSHLIPLEQPGELAARISNFVPVCP